VCGGGGVCRQTERKTKKGEESAAQLILISQRAPFILHARRTFITPPPKSIRLKELQTHEPTGGRLQGHRGTEPRDDMWGGGGGAHRPPRAAASHQQIRR